MTAVLIICFWVSILKLMIYFCLDWLVTTIVNGFTAWLRIAKSWKVLKMILVFIVIYITSSIRRLELNLLCHIFLMSIWESNYIIWSLFHKFFYLFHLWLNIMDLNMTMPWVSIRILPSSSWTNNCILILHFKIF